MPISKKKVALITSGYFPVPAAMGGAVEALDENLIKQNEIENRIQLIVFSCYNEKAEKDSKKSGYFYSFYALFSRIGYYNVDWSCSLSSGRLPKRR